MPRFLTRIRRLSESYILILLLAITVGLFFPVQIRPISSLGSVLLGLIFFFSALKMDLREVRACLRDYMMIITAVAFMLVAFPVIVYYLTLPILPSFAVAFMLLAAMPCGMTVPLLADVTGGRQDLALVLTILTSLLAPFTVPLVIHALAGSSVTVPFWPMFLTLVKVIIVPIGIANIVKALFHKDVNAASYAFKPISLALLGLLIAGIVAKQHAEILSALTAHFALALGALFILFILFHFAGYSIIFWRDRQVRLTVSTSLTYMNFTLAIYLAGQFFPTDQDVLVPIILSLIPWSLTVIPYKEIVKRMGKG